MLSGVNIEFILDRAAKRPEFRVTRFMALSAFGLFFMGWGYNLLEGTGPFTSVVQAIGVGVFVTFIMLRVGLPNWALPIVSALCLANYFFAVGARLTLSPDVEANFFWHLFIGHGEMTREGLQALWPSPYFFCLFGMIPTTGFVIMGVYIERLRGRAVWVWGALMIALTAWSYFLPGIEYNAETHPLLRADFRFLVQILPLYTGWLYVFRYWYPKARQTRFTEAIEMFGRQSLDFLIWHWILIWLVSVTTSPLTKIVGFSPAQWIRAVIVVAFLYLILPRFDAWRARVSKRKLFLRQMWAALLLSFFVAILGAATHAVALRLIAGGVAALAFILMYPAQREAWRRSSVKGECRISNVEVRSGVKDLRYRRSRREILFPSRHRRVSVFHQARRSCVALFHVARLRASPCCGYEHRVPF
ncbi:MAG: hypothetical protein M5R36_18605 [Deltaproteobacteria bacterium]|nr:hypothetical protein [Deltaproteobacteria bacterium]